MSFYNCYKLFIFTLFFPVFLLPFTLSSPIPDSPFDKFIRSLTEKECIMPKEVKLPFPKLSDPSPFSYLSAPLFECRTSNALKDNDGAKMLCTEIFDVLKNITCVRYNEPLPAIESNHLSENVCYDFKTLKDILPQKDDYFSGKLSDELTCNVVCSAEKYEQLCKTLLWSYDTLMKIKHALSSREQVQTKGNEIIDQVSLSTVSSSVKPSSTSIPPKQISQNKEQPDKLTLLDVLNPEKKSNSNQIVQEEAQNDVSSDTDEITSQNISSTVDSSNPQIQDKTINKTADAIVQNKSEPESEKLAPEVSENEVKPIEPKKLPNLNPQSAFIDHDENKINTDDKFPQKQIKDKTPQVDVDKNSLMSNASEIKEKQSVKNITTDNLSTNESNNIDSKQVNEDKKEDSKPNEKSVEPIVPAPENDNELKNGNFPNDEDKSKVKQTNLEKQEEKEVDNKPNQTDYEGPNDVLGDNDSKFPEPFTQSVLPDGRDIEHQEDRDQYNNSFNPPPKNKETDIKSSIAVSPNQMPSGYGSNINHKDSGQISEQIAVIAPFPEQEDSHFFFYFLSIVLIIMAGYLIFHNKQKIIALIVEGRHERRRRSGVGYKKLETK